MVMGCNESREKELPPIHFTFEVATPLPLHLYQEYTYPIKRSPTSSSESLSPTSLSLPSLSPISKASPTSKASPPTKTSPTTKTSSTPKSAATLHYAKMKAIAYYKFPMFNDFPPGVQEQIFNNIEKELQGK